jgi:DNA-binding response OmpR family regulator
MDGSGASILIVDDDPAACRFLAEVLENAGYGVETESDAARALDRVQHFRYGLVVSDVVMPEVSGTTLVAQLGRVHPGTPALLLSAFPDEQTRAEARALGVPLLAKPFCADMLVLLVEKLLDRAVPREVTT